jgi:hypothetical protein
MTVFAKATLDGGEWSKIQGLVSEIQIKARPHDLMMYSTDSPTRIRQDVFLGLPESVPLALFPGFTRIDQADLPNYLERR